MHTDELRDRPACPSMVLLCPPLPLPRAQHVLHCIHYASASIGISTPQVQVGNALIISVNVPLPSSTPFRLYLPFLPYCPTINSQLPLPATDYHRLPSTFYPSCAPSSAPSTLPPQSTPNVDVPRDSATFMASLSTVLRASPELPGKCPML